ncbi:MAG: iron-sulfur cluster assembly scaffold protein [Chloroflexi bacterium]|nr:iron-sulfur cluster assembly scaffold protein [Chloroflexota bacterium]
MPQYSETVIDHFMNPRNVGVIENADGVGHEGNPTCGDSMEIFIRVANVNGTERITDIRFRTFGCGAAIASSSIATEMVKGKSLEEAERLSDGEIVEALGGLPPLKVHCSLLATGALKKAIEDYRRKQVAAADS